MRRRGARDGSDRGDAMAERPIKVDEATDRTVTELAFFLRTTKKAVVATAVAVAEYASQAARSRGAAPGRDARQPRRGVRGGATRRGASASKAAPRRRRAVSS
ncbi:hypothetical protein GCM10009819_19910 [Agromyces tropicus]|uniref:Uncharacterized protein n=1 Tax=Agromyces tropicus TaxID=555371 RepID=A0ABN2UGR7_9MICO